MASQDHLKAAFAALLAGDTEERDRQCFLAEEALRAEAEQMANPHSREIAEAKFYATGLPLIKACQDVQLWLKESS